MESTEDYEPGEKPHAFVLFIYWILQSVCLPSQKVILKENAVLGKFSFKAALPHFLPSYNVGS